MYKHFRDFVKCIFDFLSQIQHSTYNVPINNDKPKFVTFLVFVCMTASFILLLKFRLSKMPQNKTPSWLQSHNGE